MHAVSASQSMGRTVIPEAERVLHDVMQSPSVERELSGHKDRITTAAWNPQGNTLVTASMDGYAKVWNTANGQQLFLLSGHTGGVLSAAWKPDGTQIATASSDGTVRIWDGTTGVYVRTLPGEEGEAVNSVSWNSEGKRLATASSVGTMSLRGRDRVRPHSGTVRVWDADTGQLLTTMPKRGDIPDSVSWSPVDPNVFATASEDEGVLRVWDVHKWAVSDFEGNSGGILAVAWSPDGRQLATGNEGKTAQVWSAETGDITHTYIGHKAAVNSVAWSWDGRRLATASDPFLFDRDNTARIWDPLREIELLTLPNLVDSVSKAAPIRGRQLSVLGPQGRASFVAWSPDGKRLVTPGEVGTVKVWDVAPEELPTLWGHDARVECVAWSPDNTRLASASWDRMVRVWDAATGKELFALKTDRKRALSVAWSPDGKKLATSGLEWTAKIWDAASGASPVLLSGHKGDTTWVTWSPDGKKLATASLDQTAKVWEATSGRELFTLTGHSGRVRRVVWSPDGKLLATAGEDHTIRLWDATTAAPFEGLDWGKLLGWYSNCNRFPATDISLVTTL
jgi:WD40 repeat protein